METMVQEVWQFGLESSVVLLTFGLGGKKKRKKNPTLQINSLSRSQRDPTNEQLLAQLTGQHATA